jgi:predicted nucleic acid-binding protein
MTVFDTDVFGEILLGNPRFVDRAAAIPANGQRVRVSTHDLRIAAVAVANSATLVSRNRRDFELIPGLSVEFWD